MKKILTIFMALLLCVGLAGCGSEEEDVKKQSEGKNIAEILSDNGYALKNRYDGEIGFEVYFKNEANGNALAYGDFYTNYSGKDELLFQFNSDNMILTQKKEIIKGNMNVEDLMNEYNNVLDKMGLNEKEVINFLKKENEEVVKKEQGKMEEHKYYESGTYLVGSDIPSGEYLFIAAGSSSRLIVKDTEYDGADTTIYTEEYDQQNAYVKLADGQYIYFDNGRLYNTDDRPTLNVNNNGMYKVGVDIEAGIYNVEPGNEEAYYSIFNIDDPYSFHGFLISDYQFTSTKKIKLEAGQYLLKRNCILKKED